MQSTIFNAFSKKSHQIVEGFDLWKCLFALFQAGSVLSASWFLPVIPAWPQESYATHGIANQAFYHLDLPSLLKEATNLDTLGVRSPTSMTLKVKGLPLTCSAKSERRDFPFSSWGELQEQAQLSWYRQPLLPSTSRVGRSWVLAVLL